MSEATIAYGTRVMTALLGVDALYRKESRGKDGLVVFNMDTEGRYPAEDFARYGEARACFEGLQADSYLLPEPDRRVYYDDLCSSTLAFIRWRQAGLSFREQLREFLHVPVRAPADGELDGIRGMIGIFLTGMGYEGDVTAQAAAWEERNRVPPAVVPEIFETLLDEAWDRTEEHVFEIPAPKSDGMKVSTVSGVHYDARCDYLARTIELNIDPILTRSALKRLATREGYPGRYVQFKMRETMAAEGLAAPDVLLSMANTASSSVTQGIGDDGVRMIDWEITKDDEVQGLMNHHRAGIGAGAAWRLHALGWPEELVADWLSQQALIGGPGWVKKRMNSISAPSRAVLPWSAWWGEQAVVPAGRYVPEEQRQDFLRFLYGRMHSISSVGMFDGPSTLPWHRTELVSWD